MRNLLDMMFNEPSASLSLMFAVEEPVEGKRNFHQLFENARIRVFACTLMAREIAQVELRHAAMLYPLAGSTVRLCFVNDETKTVAFGKEEIVWCEPLLRSIENTGAAAQKIIVVEIKESGKRGQEG